MKKLALLVIPLLLLAACSSAAPPPAADSAGDQSGLEAQLAEKDSQIADLEDQVGELQGRLEVLQDDYDALLTGSSGAAASAGSPFLCPIQLDNMKYQNAVSAIAILEGWFALQPEVGELQGSYSTQFWQDVKSRIHTIRYISADTGLSETATFLIFFEEAGWKQGLLDMTNQCWLDYPE